MNSVFAKVISFGNRIKACILGFVQKAKTMAMNIVKGIYAVFMTVVDFFITMHSEASGVSWKRFAGSVIIIFVLIGTYYGVKGLIINGEMLTRIITTAIGSVAVIYGAGAIAANLPGGGQGAAYSIIDKIKGFFAGR
jgi:uncharacterized membrane protein